MSRRSTWTPVRLSCISIITRLCSVSDGFLWTNVTVRTDAVAAACAPAGAESQPSGFNAIQKFGVLVRSFGNPCLPACCAILDSVLPHCLC